MLEPEIYRLRFSPEELAAQRRFWAPICRYLQEHIPPDGTTLDLGAGYCHFINQIQSRVKIAADVDLDRLQRCAHPGVRVLASTGTSLEAVTTGSVDAVFASNLYEHFHSREEVAQSLREVHRVLRPGGRFLILQPNFACCCRRYFDFFDHRLAFTHRGMAEGLAISGFELLRVTARFLPYTSKSRLPRWPWLVSLYLRMPVVWKILGAQMLLIARKP